MKRAIHLRSPGRQRPRDAVFNQRVGLFRHPDATCEYAFDPLAFTGKMHHPPGVALKSVSNVVLLDGGQTFAPIVRGKKAGGAGFAQSKLPESGFPAFPALARLLAKTLIPELAAVL